MRGRMGRSLSTIREEAVKIIRDEYPPIQQGVLRLEVFMRRRSKKAVYELRDFLDHLSHIWRDGITPDEAEKHLGECRTHLRRCAVEPLEYMAEKRFVKLNRYANIFGIMSFLMPSNPVTKPDFISQMQHIKALVVEGRTIKTEGQACAKMEEAFAIATDLLAQVHPLGLCVRGILALLVAIVAGLVVGLILC